MQIFELLCENNNIDIEKEDMNLIQELILGEPPSNCAASPKNFPNKNKK